MQCCSQRYQNSEHFLDQGPPGQDRRLWYLPHPSRTGPRQGQWKQFACTEFRQAERGHIWQWILIRGDKADLQEKDRWHCSRAPYQRPMFVWPRWHSLLPSSWGCTDAEAVRSSSRCVVAWLRLLRNDASGIPFHEHHNDRGDPTSLIHGWYMLPSHRWVKQITNINTPKWLIACHFEANQLFEWFGPGVLGE